MPLLIFGVAMTVASCSGGTTQDARERRAEGAVATHLDRLGVKTSGGTCDADSPARFVCELTTGRGTKVGVLVTDVHGKRYYQTLSGLIDGRTIEQRLTLDYGRQLNANVSTTCPAVITGNVGDTSTCTIRGGSASAHEVTIKILDDHTGDYTVIGSRSVAQ